MPHLLILDAEDYSVKRMLAKEWPEGAVVARYEYEGDIRKAFSGACRLTTDILQGRVPKSLTDEERERLSRRKRLGYEALVLLDPENPSCQETTKHYRLEWQGFSYRYRVPCAQWQHCENPEGPATAHYKPPSNRRNGERPILCGHCRTAAGPSVLNRAILSERNRTRGK